MPINYEIVIDGQHVREVANDASLAKKTALELAEGHKAVAILILYGGAATDEGMYWDYVTGHWVYTHPSLATQGAKPKKAPRRSP